MAARNLNENQTLSLFSRFGAIANDVGIDCGAFSGGVKVSAQAARSMGGSVGFSASVGQPSTFLIVMARTAPEGSSRNRSTTAFVESFFANLPKLVASGYPKWRDVNIAATIP